MVEQEQALPSYPPSNAKQQTKLATANIIIEICIQPCVRPANIRRTSCSTYFEDPRTEDPGIEMLVSV